LPRKYFRKYLPDAQTVRNHRWLGRLGAWLHHPKLWHLNRDSVAGAVAIGLFCGLVPGPLQMLSAAILSVLLHRNLPVALIVTLYSNPFTIVPLYALAYGYGRLFVGGNDGNQLRHFEMDWSDLAGSLMRLADWMLTLGKPLAVGLPALAATLAFLGYWAVQFGWRAYVMLAWRARRRRRAGGPPP